MAILVFSCTVAFGIGFHSIQSTILSSSFADEVSVGDEVLVNEKNELISQKVLDVSSLMKTGKFETFINLYHEIEGGTFSRLFMYNDKIGSMIKKIYLVDKINLKCRKRNLNSNCTQ